MHCAFSIVIPTYLRHESLDKTVLSVIQYAPQGSEVIVVDQSPGADSHADRFMERYPGLHYICIKKPSLPNARNIGARYSTAPLVLFIDDDATVHPDCFREHLLSHDNQETHIVAGRVKQTNPEVQWAPVSAVAAINPETGETTANFDLEYTGEVVYATGCHFSVKKQVFAQVGLFNTRFTGNALFEDVDFCLRARKKGFAILYNPRAIVFHHAVKIGGCHQSRNRAYLNERLHNRTLFFVLHCHLIPGREFLVYTKNLVEFITRTQNGSHSLRLGIVCSFILLKAYADALLSSLLPTEHLSEP
jgi:hypothetical protein